MATFVSTITFTEQGIKSVRDTTRRAASFKAAAKKLGVKVLDVYWCLGPFDGLLLFEAPDTESATSAMLYLGSQGNVKTQTAQVFTASEVEKVLKAAELRGSS
jgi:uncharacterized protein with GYD domain